MPNELFKYVTVDEICGTVTGNSTISKQKYSISVEMVKNMRFDQSFLMHLSKEMSTVNLYVFVYFVRNGSNVIFLFVYFV